MKKKPIALILVVLSLLGLLGGFTGTAFAEDRKVLEYNTIFVISKERIPDENSLLDQYLLEHFGIKNNWESIPSTDYEEKLNLIFAAKDIPDYAWPVSITAKIAKRFGSDGFLLPVDEYMEYLPNYRALFTDTEWAALMLTEANSDGHLYYLPQKNYRDTAFAWIYREDAFEAMGLEVPTTLDELYDVLTAIKAQDPDSTPYGNAGKLSLLDGLCVASGIRRSVPYVTRDNEFVPYGQVTDEYREVLKYARKMYDEGLVSKEFATLTEQQTTEMYANGKVYIHYYYPATRIPWAEENMRALYPDVKWNYTTTNITTDPDGFFSWEKEDAYVTAGPIFTEALTEEKMIRLLEFYDWLATDEGALFITMGVEGETFEYVDGEPQFMEHMYHITRNPDGTKDWKYGLYLGNLVQHPAYLKEVNKLVDQELSQALRANEKGVAFPTIGWTYSADDEKKLNSLDVVIKDVTDEYSMKFIMGQLDPNSDSDWQSFLKALDGVGLQDASKIRSDNHVVVQ